MSYRPYKDFTLEVIGSSVEKMPFNVRFLDQVIDELAFRESLGVAELLVRVRQLLAEIPKEHLIKDGAEVWIDFEALISRQERAYILRSPAGLVPYHYEGMSLWQQGLELARSSEHTLVPAVSEALKQSGTNLHVNSNAFGLAVRLATFEIRNATVTSWPAFALLFRKMLGEACTPWLPMLFLAAIAAPDATAPDFDVNDVLNFHSLII